MISKCTRKAQHDKLYTDLARKRLNCSTPIGKLKVDFVAIEMWLRGNNARHCPHRVFWLACKRCCYLLYQARSGPGCWCLFRRAGIRSGRIRNTAKKHQRACRFLFKGGALPQSMYGHQIWGIPPTAMKRLRAAAAWTSGGYRAGICTTTLVSITKTEPASRLHVEVIADYLVFLRDHPPLVKRIERSWQLLIRCFANAPVKRQWFSSHWIPLKRHCYFAGAWMEATFSHALDQRFG